MITDEEKTVIGVQKVREVLADMVEKKLPEQGPNKQVYVTFEYPGTEYVAALVAEADSLDQGG